MEWVGISGSGAGGRIVERDVRAAVQAGRDLRALEAGATRSPATVTLLREARGTEFVAYLDRLRESMSGEPCVPHLCTALLLKLSAAALTQYPALNVVTEGGRPRQVDDPRIGVRIHAGNAASVAVIREAHRRSVLQLAAELSALSDTVTGGRLSEDQIHGATCVLVDMADSGVDTVIPALGSSGVATLAAGRARRGPVSADASEPRSLICVSLTYDYGYDPEDTAGKLLDMLCSAMEQPPVFLALSTCTRDCVRLVDIGTGAP